MDKWVRQLKQERQGVTPKASLLTPEKIKSRELKKEWVPLLLEQFSRGLEKYCWPYYPILQLNQVSPAQWRLNTE